MYIFDNLGYLANVNKQNYVQSNIVENIFPFSVSSNVLENQY